MLQKTDITIKKSFFAVVAGLVACGAAIAAFYQSFIYFNAIMLTASVIAALASAFFIAFFAQNKINRILFAVMADVVLIFTAVLPTFLSDRVYDTRVSSLVGGVIITVIISVLFCIWFVSLKKTNKKKSYSVFLVLLFAAFVCVSVVCGVMQSALPLYKDAYPNSVIYENQLNNYNFASQIKLTAHRGYSWVAPENTCAAFEEAGKAGFYGCEFDIRATSDGEWVIMHNQSVNLMTNGIGLIKNLTFDEINSFYINSGKSINKYNWGEIKVATLKQALDICKKYSMRPFIEIKSGSQADVTKLLNILKEEQLCSKAVIIAFDYSYLEQINQNNSEIELMLLANDIDDDIVEKCRKIGCGLDFDARKQKNLDYLQNHNLSDISLAAWTIDNISLASRLIKDGITTLTTNKILPVK